MRKALDYILGIKPDQSARIIELYNKDEDFRTLCDDYLASAEALAECRNKVLKERQYENEFMEINLELEREINHLLHDRNT